MARVAALFIVLVFALPLHNAGLAAAQQESLKNTIYTSPLWGYTVRWHGGAWDVTNDITSPDTNLLSLSDGNGNFVTYMGVERFAGDAAACLDDMQANAFSNPESTKTAPFTYDDGEPVAWHEQEQAYVLLSTFTEQDDGTVDEGVLYLECQTLVPGEAVFQRLYSGSAASFEAANAEVIDMLESVALPASAWLPDEDDPTFVSAGYSPLRDVSRYEATFFPTDAENSQLLITLVDRAGYLHAITFENVSEQPVAVDPRNVTHIYVDLERSDDEVRHAAVSSSWEDGATVNSDGTRTLAPGERATVDIEFTPFPADMIDCDALPFMGYEYRDAHGSSASFADFDPPSCTTAAASVMESLM